MLFKKINPTLNENLLNLGWEEVTETEKKVFASIKSGADLILTADEAQKRNQMLIIGMLQRIGSQPKGDNPKGLIFVKDKATALAIEEEVKMHAKGMEIRVHTAYEEQLINKQKDAIYLGSDLVIATPKRLSKLYFLNGINLTELKVLSVLNADFLNGTPFHTDIHRITQSLKQCQYIITTEKENSIIKKLKPLFLSRAVSLNL